MQSHPLRMGLSSGAADTEPGDTSKLEFKSRATPSVIVLPFFGAPACKAACRLPMWTPGPHQHHHYKINMPADLHKVGRVGLEPTT
jgi:hypothetical protein